jgi:hypothetical protein
LLVDYISVHDVWNQQQQHQQQRADRIDRGQHSFSWGLQGELDLICLPLREAIDDLINDYRWEFERQPL